MLEEFSIQQWQETIEDEIQNKALTAVENGQVLFLPQLAFNLLPEEKIFLTSQYVNPKTKNVSYDASTRCLRGAICTANEASSLSQMMLRYAQYSKALIDNLLPHYKNTIIQARTSFRPVEISGRKVASYRKDDTRLHVDAFPATPMGKQRILRVFTNVNPEQSRVWRLGAPFLKVVEYFRPQLKKPLYGSAFLLHKLKITKTKRTLYDHYMLQLHNAMKADMAYQNQVPQMEFHFPPESSWIGYTDQVSHAAMSGQFTFEQTFYVPQDSLAEIEKSPCKILEKFLNMSLL